MRDIDKKSIFFSLIIRQYLAECVILMTAVDYSYSVWWSDRN